MKLLANYSSGTRNSALIAREDRNRRVKLLKGLKRNPSIPIRNSALQNS
uniref:Uncharacterized protein n=1 Tax=Utricularia reniformis TaxID=192314 RepID=A0A1Y0B320_9LAMI|nr:hypothetical protein AEK19_MT1617 [Utricularia reniformis]ART31801.1 hypothetical protein AEK19_MT1617 [Utricularia reniformis]